MLRAFTASLLKLSGIPAKSAPTAAANLPKQLIPQQEPPPATPTSSPPAPPSSTNDAPRQPKKSTSPHLSYKPPPPPPTRYGAVPASYKPPDHELRTALKRAAPIAEAFPEFTPNEALELHYIMMEMKGMQELEELERKREEAEIEEMIREVERLQPAFERQNKFTYEPLVKRKAAKEKEVSKRKSAGRSEVVETHEDVRVEGHSVSEMPEVTAKEEIVEERVPEESEAETVLEKKPQGFGEYLTTKLGLRKQLPIFTTLEPKPEPATQEAVKKVHDGSSSAFEAKFAEETPKSEITPEAGGAETTAASTTVEPEIIPEPEETMAYVDDSSPAGDEHITTTETAEPEAISDDPTKPRISVPEPELEQQDTAEELLSSSSPAAETASLQDIPKSKVVAEEILVPRLPKIFELEAAPEPRMFVPLLVDVGGTAFPEQADISDEVAAARPEPLEYYGLTARQEAVERETQDQNEDQDSKEMNRREKRLLKQKEAIQAAKTKAEEKARRRHEAKVKKQEEEAKARERKEKNKAQHITKEAESPAEDAPLHPKQTPPAAQSKPVDEKDKNRSQPIAKETEVLAEDGAAEKRPEETESRASSEPPASFASYTQFALGNIDGDTALAKDLYAAEVLKFERMRDSFQKQLKAQEKRCHEQEVIIERLATAKAALQDIDKWGDKFKPQAGQKK